MSEIYIVDDDPAVAESTLFLLRTEGFAIRRVYNPIELLRRGPFGASSCLMFDMSMPELTGIELMTELTRRGWAARCIVTGTEAEMEAEALAAGASAFLLKPYRSEELFSAVHEVLAPVVSSSANV